MKTALITGASSGIGKATAKNFAEAGIDLIICGRRREKLEELRQELSGKVKVHVLSFDVSRRTEVSDSLGSLPKEFSQVDILVNNAGNAHGMDPIQTGDLEDWETMIDINLKGLLYVSRLIIPSMVERGQGHIINIGSIAGKEVYPNGNVYCATKHAVEALNEAMRIDLNGHGIRVGAVHPGLVETEFSRVRFKGDREKASAVYQGLEPLKPEDVADIITFMVTRPPHVNIADVLLLPTAQANGTIVHKNNSTN